MKPRTIRRDDRRHKPSVLRDLRNYMLAGLLVAAPVGLTWYICTSVFNYVDLLLRDRITAHLKQLIPAHWVGYVDFPLYGIGILGVVVFLIILGAVTQNFVGRKIVGLFQRVIMSIPVVRWVYNLWLQVFEAIFSNNRIAFTRVVMVQFPGPNLWRIGFVTGAAEHPVFHQAIDAGELLFVYLPTTPNITAGWLFVVPERETVTLDIPVEDAVKMMVSGGIYMPQAEEAMPSEVTAG